MKNILIIILFVFSLISCKEENKDIIGNHSATVEINIKSVKKLMKQFPGVDFKKPILKYQFNNDNTGFSYIEISDRKIKLPFIWEYIKDEKVKVTIFTNDSLVFEYVDKQWKAYSKEIEGYIILKKE